MTDRVKALQELLVKVESGEWFPGLAQLSFGGVHNYHYAHSAYGGSLDAAKALHEAVLPGWYWSLGISSGSASVFLMTVPHDGNIHDAEVHKNPARAWLIAIIKALIAEAKK